jgi:hypothetical protein
MLLKFLFGQLSVSRQVRFLKNHGVMVGVRKKKHRQAYLYMFRNIFAEILYKNDDPGEKAESVMLFVGLKKLNYHLEREIKSAI